MNVIDHGMWVRYTPEVLPETAPNGAVFARRESDGVDWYDYVRPDFLRMYPPKLPSYDPKTGKVIEPNLKSNFRPGSIICNVSYHANHDKHLVGAATTDPTAIYAINQRVIEIVDYTGQDAQKEFGGKAYDHVKKTFSERPKLPPPPPTPFEEKVTAVLDELIKRLDKLESK